MPELNMALLVPAGLGMVGGLYLIAGIAGLITGGPRKGKAAQSPRLFDPVYFLLRIILGASIMAMSVLLWLVFQPDSLPYALDGLFRSAGVVMMAMVLPPIVRGQMINLAAKYRAENGF